MGERRRVIGTDDQPSLYRLQGMQGGLLPLRRAANALMVELEAAKEEKNLLLEARLDKAT